nr:MAG TPA: hypothetical protein [Caudoviricetes sp.]
MPHTPGSTRPAHDAPTARVLGPHILSRLQI